MKICKRRKNIVTGFAKVTANGVNSDKMYEKKYNIFKKLLAYGGDFIYNADVVTLIALKREVAAVCAAGFPWSECQVLRNWRQVTVQEQLSGKDRKQRVEYLGYTRERVQSPLVVLMLSAKRRRLFLWQVK